MVRYKTTCELTVNLKDESKKKQPLGENSPHSSLSPAFLFTEQLNATSSTQTPKRRIKKPHFLEGSELPRSGTPHPPTEPRHSPRVSAISDNNKVSLTKKICIPSG